MINSESIQMMKHGVRLLNFARGDLVVNEDLLAGLEEKQVRCYFTDFPSEDLLGHPGVLVIPHLGASTPESEDNCARMAAEELVDYLENGNIRNSVNLPSVSMPRSGDSRITLIHRNIPAMLTQFAPVLSDSGLNIETSPTNPRRTTPTRWSTSRAASAMRSSPSSATSKASSASTSTGNRDFKTPPAPQGGVSFPGAQKQKARMREIEREWRRADKIGGSARADGCGDAGNGKEIL